MKINIFLLNDFKQWLSTLGYASGTVYASLSSVKSFFFYLEANKMQHIESIRTEHIQSYYSHLQTRKNKRRTGALSVNTLRTHINALKRFSRFLEETKALTLEIKIVVPTAQYSPKTILTQQEIKALYGACTNDVLGLRDRAILAVYYA